MEKFSRICFEYLIYPWDCTQYEYDTGIDLFVQPYDEKKRNQKDNSLYPFEKRFLVQLKSTKAEVIDAKLNVGRLQIDTKHLLSWRKQKDPVMIARYYFKHKCFYYNWIDEIEIKESNGSQVIELPYKINDIYNNLDGNIYQENLKENIFEKLVPPTISDLVYVPNGPNSGTAHIRINRIRNGQQIFKLLKSGLMQQIEKEANIKFQIQKIKNILLKDNKNIANRFKLALLYIEDGNTNEALSELNILIYNFKSIEAKILFSLVESRSYSILKNLDDYNFGYYIKMSENFPEAAEIEMKIDGELFNLGTYRKEGLIFPKQRFSKINEISWKLAMINKGRLGSGSIFSSRIITSTKMKIYRGLISKNNDIIEEYSGLILEEKLSISGLNIV